MQTLFKGKEYNLLIDNPQLCKEWNHNKNDKLPQDYTPGSSESVWWTCKECGYESAKWLGKCPGCNSWNSFVEEKINKQSKSKSSSKGFSNTFNNKKSIIE